MQPIRILQVIGLMNPGGIETMLLNLYKNIDREQVQFDFLAHYGEEGAYDKEIKKLGGNIYQMPQIKSLEKQRTYYYKVFQYIKALNVFFADHTEFKIIHGHMTNTAMLYMYIAKKYGNKCCIAHSHLTQARPGMSGFVTDLLHKPVAKIADEYFACSDMAAHWIFSMEDIKRKGVKILKNGIQTELYSYDAEKANNKKKELGLEGKFVIGNVARFKKEKNQTFLIDVFSVIYKREPNAVLIFVGDGETCKDAKKKVTQLGLDDAVKFLGIRYDVPEIMLAMDVFVLPSLYEGLPVVGIEAQASGLPCIISLGVTKETDVTGLCEFIDLDSNIYEWVDAILKYKYFSKEKRVNTKYKIIKAGYDIKETAKYMQDFYLRKYEEVSLRK